MLKTRKSFSYIYKPKITNLFKKFEFPTINIGENFLKEIKDKNFFFYNNTENVKVKSICQENNSIKFFKVKYLSNTLNFDLISLMERVETTKKPCIYISRCSNNLQIYYGIPIIREGIVDIMMYGVIPLSKMEYLFFKDSPFTETNNLSNINIDEERILLYNVSKHELFLELCKYCDDEIPENIYIADTKESKIIYRFENKNAPLEYDKIFNLYTKSSGKNYTFENKYVLNFCDIKFGDNFFIIALLHDTKEDLFNLSKSMLSH